MDINTKTQIYAIIGDPVEHSKSPAMQNEFFVKPELMLFILLFMLLKIICRMLSADLKNWKNCVALM